MNLFSIQHATRVITAETVFLYVLLIVRRVNTQTERVLARRGGWVQAVQQVILYWSVIHKPSIFYEMILARSKLCKIRHLSF